LEIEDELTDEQNVKMLRLSTKMMEVLRLLQKALPEPFREIIGLMESRLAYIEVELERGDSNHAQFLRASIPRMWTHLNRLNGARDYGGLKVAVDTVVNELHWGFPMVSHITRAFVGGVKKEERARTKEAIGLAAEICRLRDKLCFQRGTSNQRSLK